MTRTQLRWVTPEGSRIQLNHYVTAGPAYRNPRSRSAHIDGGLVAGGYWLDVHSRSGILVSSTPLGAEPDWEELAAALAAVDAYDVTGLPRPA
jgi:hypothetical protein